MAGIITDITNDWTNDCERLILFADIMGFKEAVMSNHHDKLKNRLLKFKQSFDGKIKPLCEGDYLRFVQFSDSIIIVVNGVDSKMVDLITRAGILLMHEALSNGFPIKGVISKGEFTYDESNDLYFGRPLVDAALLHDELYYYGIVVHHTAEKVIKDNLGYNIPYCINSISIKKGKTTHYHLVWNMAGRDFNYTDITIQALEWLCKIQESVSGAPRIYIDNTIAILKSDEVEFAKHIKTLSEKEQCAEEGYSLPYKE